MIDLKTKPANLNDLKVAVLGAKRSGIAAAILAARRVLRFFYQIPLIRKLPQNSIPH
jgi:hypothetical protein